LTEPANPPRTALWPPSIEPPPPPVLPNLMASIAGSMLGPRGKTAPPSVVLPQATGKALLPTVEPIGTSRKQPTVTAAGPDQLGDPTIRRIPHYHHELSPFFRDNVVEFVPQQRLRAQRDNGNICGFQPIMAPTSDDHARHTAVLEELDAIFRRRKSMSAVEAIKEAARANGLKYHVNLVEKELSPLVMKLDDFRRNTVDPAAELQLPSDFFNEKKAQRYFSRTYSAAVSTKLKGFIVQELKDACFCANVLISAIQSVCYA
jgi:hypothetical protein